jgi:hypothetical protein
MKFTITRTSYLDNFDEYKEVLKKYNFVNESTKYEKSGTIEINTLEDLIKLSDETNQNLIIGGDEEERYIEIYDDYRE